VGFVYQTLARTVPLVSTSLAGIRVHVLLDILVSIALQILMNVLLHHVKMVAHVRTVLTVIRVLA